MLVVVEDGDVERLLQPLLDLEAARGGDVLEVDAAEGRAPSVRTALTISSASWVSRQIGKASTPANSLNSMHLPSITGIAASGPMLPSPSTALPSETTATVFFLIVYSKALARSCVDVHADAGDAGRVGHREVVARLHRVLVVHVDLAAAVHLHRAVDVVEHPGAAGRADRAQDLLPVLAVGGVDRELAHPLALAAGAGHEVDALQLPARLGDRRGQFAQRLLPRIELDPDRDAVLGADGHRGYRIRFDRPPVPGPEGGAPTN